MTKLSANGLVDIVFRISVPASTQRGPMNKNKLKNLIKHLKNNSDKNKNKKQTKNNQTDNNKYKKRQQQKQTKQTCRAGVHLLKHQEYSFKQGDTPPPPQSGRSTPNYPKVLHYRNYYKGNFSVNTLCMSANYISLQPPTPPILPINCTLNIATT